MIIVKLFTGNDLAHCEKQIPFSSVHIIQMMPNQPSHVNFCHDNPLIRNNQHAKRLYPLQFSSKKTLEWGYHSGDDENVEWKLVDKTAVADAVEGLEKLIGFEGRPDPASGYYCVYDGGRLKLGEETSFN